LFVTPNEVEPPSELRQLEHVGNVVETGIESAFVEPECHAIHLALLPRSRQAARKFAFVEKVCARLFAEGPQALTKRELMTVLWNAKAVSWIHHRLWQTPAAALHPSWQRAMRERNSANGNV